MTGTVSPKRAAEPPGPASQNAGLGSSESGAQGGDRPSSPGTGGGPTSAWSRPARAATIAGMSILAAAMIATNGLITIAPDRYSASEVPTVPDPYAAIVEIDITFFATIATSEFTPAICPIAG